MAYTTLCSLLSKKKRESSNRKKGESLSSVVNKTSVKEKQELKHKENSAVIAEQITEQEVCTALAKVENTMLAEIPKEEVGSEIIEIGEVTEIHEVKIIGDKQKKSFGQATEGMNFDDKF